MDWFRVLYDLVRPVVPLSATIVGILILLYAVRLVAAKRYAGTEGFRFRLQMLLLTLSFVGLLAILLVLPISETTRGQLLGLLGIVLSAAIALSSTTFVGNAMAGFMLRAVGSFRPGDFVRIGEHFGRVSERGLFHVEIQTEDRDLTTLPNLYLVTNPYKVVRSSGTIISAEVSLGYDVSSARITKCLLAAAAAAELQEPFVHIMELGDFSVVYRIAGLLPEVRQILSARARLRAEMLHALHADGIEIVSPTFMNTRAHPPERSFVPADARPAVHPPAGRGPEAVAFDKAEEAESLVRMRESLEATGRELADLEERLGRAAEPDREALQQQIDALKARRERLAARIAERQEAAGS